jgi:hypothetical protein
MKEAALLVLATVSDSESILPLLSPYLNQIVPCVMAELNSISPLVRSSSINVLSKFSDWIVKQNNLQQYFERILSALVDADTNV